MPLWIEWAQQVSSVSVTQVSLSTACARSAAAAAAFLSPFAALRSQWKHWSDKLHSRSSSTISYWRLSLPLMFHSLTSFDFCTVVDYALARPDAGSCLSCPPNAPAAHRLRSDPSNYQFHLMEEERHFCSVRPNLSNRNLLTYGIFTGKGKPRNKSQHFLLLLTSLQRGTQGNQQIPITCWEVSVVRACESFKCQFLFKMF